MICYPSKQQLWQESVRWSTGDRKTDIPDTHFLTPPASPPPPFCLCTATTTPGTTHTHTHTSGWQRPNLASLKLMFFSTPLILICFLVLPFSPSHPLPFMFSVFPQMLPLCITLSLPTCSQGSKNIKWNIWATTIFLATVEVALVCARDGSSILLFFLRYSASP